MRAYHLKRTTFPQNSEKPPGTRRVDPIKDVSRKTSSLEHEDVVDKHGKQCA